MKPITIIVTSILLMGCYKKSDIDSENGNDNRNTATDSRPNDDAAYEVDENDNEQANNGGRISSDDTNRSKNTDSNIVEQDDNDDSLPSVSDTSITDTDDISETVEQSTSQSYGYFDFTTYHEKLRERYEKVYSGHIEEGRLGNVPCRWEGNTFTLKLVMPDEMICYDGETNSPTGCGRAHQSSLSITGTFEIENAPPIDISGSVLLNGEQGWAEIMIELHLLYDSPFYHENFDMRPEQRTFEVEEVAYFDWSGRLSEETADDVVWEVCNCVVDSEAK